jgi:threonine dehydrogenase-like Zn-dependent dehydrogenase
MNSEAMRAWVFDGPRRMRMETRPVPSVGAGDVRLRVAWVGICGSDVHGYAGESGMRVPGIVMGHEASGIVDAIGPGVDDLELGQEVTFAPTMPCDGSCGHTAENLCRNLRLIGVTPGLQGAFADYVVLPARRIFPLNALGLAAGSSVEPLSVGVHSAQQARVGAGDNVLVLGGGMIGQAAAHAARLRGAATVTVSDPLPERRAVAQSAGFTAVAPDELDALAETFDSAIDAVGLPATLRSAILAVRRAGTVALVGFGLPVADLKLYDVIGHERVLVGSSCYTDAEFREVLAALTDGRLDVASIAPVDIGLDDLGAAIEELAAGEQTAIKVRVRTGAV